MRFKVWYYKVILYLQLKREPRPFPKLVIKRKVCEIDDFVAEDFELVGYNPHPKITMPMAVWRGVRSSHPSNKKSKIYNCLLSIEIYWKLNKDIRKLMLMSIIKSNSPVFECFLVV